MEQTSEDAGIALTVADGSLAGGFDQWYRDEYRPVLTIALALTGDVGTAEDITQEAFAAASATWNELLGHPNPSAWIRRVVANKAASWVRRLQNHRRIQQLLRNDRTPEVPLPHPEVWAAVRRLPRRQAQVVALHYLEDRPVTDIAELLDLSPGSVKTHLSRGRANLRAALGEGGNDVS